MNKSFPFGILAASSHPQERSITLVCGLRVIFIFQGMSKKSSFVQIRVLKCLRGYLTHATVMTVNALVGSQLDYCNSLFRSLSAVDLHELQYVPNSLVSTTNTPTSLLSGSFSIGCLLNTVPYSRLPYWCTSSYIVVIQNILHPFLNPDKVSITAKHMVCSLISPTLLLQCISLLSILA